MAWSPFGVLSLRENRPILTGLSEITVTQLLYRIEEIRVLLYVETDSGLIERPDEKAEASGRWGLLERWTGLDWTGLEGKGP